MVQTVFSITRKKGGMNEKANTLQGILPETDSSITADSGRTGRSDEGSGLVGDGQTPRSDSKGKEDATTLACLIKILWK